MGVSSDATRSPREKQKGDPSPSPSSPTVGSDREEKRRFGVRAFYLANQIDIYSLAEKKQETDPLVPQQIQRNHVIFSLHDDAEEAGIGTQPSKYLAFYEYGAAVFFLGSEEGGRENVIASSASNAEFVSQTLEETYNFCKDTEIDIPTSEEYTVEIDSNVENWCAIGDNRIHVEELDIHNVRIISEILAQSVALQYYETQAVGMLKQFRSTNSTMIQSGSSKLNKNLLFKMTAENNKILIDIMLNLGLLDRAGPISWHYTKYYRVWELMRDEFEIQRRFNRLEEKISLVQDNAKYVLEVLSSRKGERLELIIIGTYARAQP